MTTTPVYILRHAFETEPLCSVFGFDGLVETAPKLEPSLYSVAEHGSEVGVIEFWTNGRWRINMHDGRTAGPGFAIVWPKHTPCVD
jgi:hypothetical protein